MTCQICAIDLLKAAETAFDAGNIISASQALLEASTEIADPGNARAVLGERARMLAYGTRPNFTYWIAALGGVQQSPVTVSMPVFTPCSKCPGAING